MGGDTADLAQPAVIYFSDLDRDGGSAGACQIVFCVARLDNREDLSRLLSVEFRTPNPDLILAAYKKFGTDCAKYLLGDFAFAIRDPGKGCIFAARDFMGCQPVYYTSNDTRFALAERMDQLLELDDVSREPDEPFIAASLSYATADHERTFFRDIRKIPGAHSLSVKRKRLCLSQYWRPEDVKEQPWADHGACLDHFRTLMRQAVRDRLPETGKTGVHVSGGLDCSSVASLAATELGLTNKSRPVALTWYPPPKPDHSELERREYARIESVCNAAGLDPIYTTPTRQSVIETLARDHRVRPICNASYNEGLVLKEAQARGVTTILSGWGGDEAASFNGRGYFPGLALRGQWITLARIARSKGRSPLRFCLSNLLTGITHRFLSDSRLRAMHYDVNGWDVPRWKALTGALLPGSRRSGQPSSNREAHADPDVQPYIDQAFRQRVDPLPRLPPVRYSDDRSTRCQLLRYSPTSARMESWAADGARHGIRYAYPLLDKRVVEFALSLPGHVFLDERWDRLFFRQAAEPFLPANVCWQSAKQDPARAEPLIQALKAAWISVGTRLQQEGTWPARARYVDMPALIAALDPERVQKRQRLARLVQAMEFLGTENLPPD